MLATFGIGHGSDMEDLEDLISIRLGTCPAENRDHLRCECLPSLLGDRNRLCTGGTCIHLQYFLKSTPGESTAERKIRMMQGREIRQSSPAALCGQTRRAPSAACVVLSRIAGWRPAIWWSAKGKWIGLRQMADVRSGNSRVEDDVGARDARKWNVRPSTANLRPSTGFNS
jgi:hypothetical protein